MQQTRMLESKHAHSVTWNRFDHDGHFLALPDNLWDIVIFRQEDHVAVLRTGLTTRPDKVSFKAGDELLILSFRPHCFMPTMPGEEMRNEGVFLDLCGRRAVRIGPAFHETPTFENAEAFVDRLIATGAIEANPIVASLVQGPSCA